MLIGPELAMLGIDRGHSGIALNHTLAGGHLRALVVGAIALSNRALRAATDTSIS